MKLVVVESPAKAKTIEKYLGPGHRVLASYGHVRDLPPKDGSVQPDQGFAMDWASSGDANPSALRLLTGDVHSKIFLTTTTPSGFNALSQPFTSHTSSVEDLQWSPSEPTVFASCSADQSVRVWDVRAKGRQSVAGIERAHESDVNVISWNRATTYLLLSGGDEGGIKVWDLRNVKKAG